MIIVVSSELIVFVVSSELIVFQNTRELLDDRHKLDGGIRVPLSVDQHCAGIGGYLLISIMRLSVDQHCALSPSPQVPLSVSIVFIVCLPLPRRLRLSSLFVYLSSSASHASHDVKCSLGL